MKANFVCGVFMRLFSFRARKFERRIKKINADLCDGKNTMSPAAIRAAIEEARSFLAKRPERSSDREKERYLQCFCQRKSLYDWTPLEEGEWRKIYDEYHHEFTPVETELSLYVDNLERNLAAYEKDLNAQKAIAKL